MEFDFTLILVALPIAFVLGWLASRLDIRQLRIAPSNQCKRPAKLMLCAISLRKLAWSSHPAHFHCAFFKSLFMRING